MSRMSRVSAPTPFMRDPEKVFDKARHQVKKNGSGAPPPTPRPESYISIYNDALRRIVLHTGPLCRGVFNASLIIASFDPSSILTSGMCCHLSALVGTICRLLG